MSRKDPTRITDKHTLQNIVPVFLKTYVSSYDYGTYYEAFGKTIQTELTNDRYASSFKKFIAYPSEGQNTACVNTLCANEYDKVNIIQHSPKGR